MSKVKGGSWIQCPITLKLIPKHEYRERERNIAPAIHGDIESFKSPIDGRLISDRSHLRRHNAEHGVTDYRDYGDKWFEKKAREREAAFRGDSADAKRERVNDIKRAMETLNRR